MVRASLNLAVSRTLNTTLLGPDLDAAARRDKVGRQNDAGRDRGGAAAGSRVFAKKMSLCSALMTLAFFNRKLFGNSPHHPDQRRDKVLIRNRFISFVPPYRFFIRPAMHSFGSGRQFVANERGIRLLAKATLDVLNRR